MYAGTEQETLEGGRERQLAEAIAKMADRPPFVFSTLALPMLLKIFS